jgi:hypothetical protein
LIEHDSLYFYYKANSAVKSFAAEQTEVVIHGKTELAGMPSTLVGRSAGRSRPYHRVAAARDVLGPMPER